MSVGSMHQPNFAVLLGIAWLLVVVQLMAEFWAMTGYTLPDADDAMRLVEMRDFLAGQGWFDMHQVRVAPPEGFDSHWSRLIDAGLAGLFLLFRLFADRALAERLMLALWPVLWLIPVMGAATAIAWRMAGREAAYIALLLAVFGLPGMGQFRPGRIDHHNVQIALALVVIAATVWSDRLRFAAPLAGAVTGLALAIGLESLPMLALCGGAFGLRYLFDPAAAAPLRAYGLALAASTLVAFPGLRRPRSLDIELLRAACAQFGRRRHCGWPGLGLASSRLVARRLWTRCAALVATAAGAGLPSACGSSRAASADRSPSWIRPSARCG